MTPARMIAAPTLLPLTGPAAGVAAAIHAAAADAPWSVETIGGLLAHAGAFGLLAVAGEEPQGFIVCRVAADEAEILTLAVLPAARRRGFGRALLAGAGRQAVAAGAVRLLLEVSVVNAPALALYRSVGFRDVGRRKGYYVHAQGAAVDAAVMALDLR